MLSPPSSNNNIDNEYLSLLPSYKKNTLLLIDDTQDPDHGKAEPVVKKAALDVKDAAFEKAKEFVKGGGSIDTIKSKYDLSTEAATILSQL